jgi:Rrf2 family protein
MLCLSKKTEYALMALAYLAERPGRVASAREIASEHGLPLALLMNILKTLQGHEVLESTRGVKGGYRIGVDLAQLTLHEFVAIVECHGERADRPDGAVGGCGCMDEATPAGAREMARVAGSAGPVQALQLRLVRFLRDVRVADLVTPGRRIDVPVERLRRAEPAVVGVGKTS